MESQSDSNADKKQTDKPWLFKKGDPRINRKGRPKNFDALRRLTLQIACEMVKTDDADEPLSRVELLMREWAKSKDPRKQQAFIEYAYGKVPAPVELSGKDGAPIRYLIDIGKDESTDSDRDAEAQRHDGTEAVLE